jgi:fumarate hydratase subunit alpha
MGTNRFTHFRIRQEITYDAAMATASTVRDIDVTAIAEAVERLLVESNYRIRPISSTRCAPRLHGSSRRSGGALEQLIENYEVAAAEQLPVCQDSGVTVVMLEVGQDVH